MNIWLSSFVLVSELLISHSLKQFPSSYLQNRNCNRFQNLFRLIPRHAKLKTRSFLRKYPDKELFFWQSTKQRFVSCKLSTLYFPLFWNDQSSKLKAVNHQIHTAKLLSVNFQNNAAFKETRTYVRWSSGGSASILDFVQLPILVNIIVFPCYIWSKVFAWSICTWNICIWNLFTCNITT